MKISLLVIRCKVLVASKDFYEKLGMSFSREEHHNGPAHYSCEHDGCVFELYPSKGETPHDNNRLGFKVLDIASTIKQVTVVDSYKFAGNKIYVVTDPDGRKVEISE